MKRSIAVKAVALAALALAGLGAVKAANAGTDVYFSLGVPAPVYAPPAVVYEQSQPVYVAPPYGYRYGYSWQQRRAWREAQWRRHREWEARREWREHHRWHDEDD
jgi:hypothetical protein